MLNKPYYGTGFYVDPPSPRVWQVCQALNIPYVGDDTCFGTLSPAKAVVPDFSNDEPSLPVTSDVSIREVAATPLVIQQLCYGIINWAYLKNTGNVFELHSIMKTVDHEYGKLLRTNFPKDGISGQCDMPVKDGSFADAALTDATFAGDPFVPEDEDLLPSKLLGLPSLEPHESSIATMRSHAVMLYSWLASYLVRAHDWKPNPPTMILVNHAGKQRAVFDFRTPLDKVTMSALNLVLQAIFPSQANSHCSAARRGVNTAIEQVKELLSQGYIWVQALDLRKAFPSVNRAVAIKKVKAIVAEQVMNSPNFVLGLPSKEERLAAAMHLIEATMDIPFAKDKKTGDMVDVSKLGLFQGSSLSGVYLNMCLDSLDKKFVPTILGDKNAVYVRYCDNFLVLAKSYEAGKAALECITSYCHGHLKVKVRHETNIFNLLASDKRVPFLGLSVGFKDGNPNARITGKCVKRIAKALGELDSIGQIKRGVEIVFRHYARGQFLTGHVVKRLCVELQVALNTNFGGSNAQANNGCLSYKALLATLDIVNGKVFGNTGGELLEEAVAVDS